MHKGYDCFDSCWKEFIEFLGQSTTISFHYRFQHVGRNSRSSGLGLVGTEVLSSITFIEIVEQFPDAWVMFKFRQKFSSKLWR